MDKQQAQEIIRETFENSFDKKRFTFFAKNLLNQIEDTPFTYQGNYIPDAYKQYIKALERIGKFSDGENSIDILIVTLKKQTSLEHARTMQRNFIAYYLNGSRGGVKKDAALVAFVSPDKEDWRFSLVKMDYKFEQTKTGKVKVKEEFTPARRWSFLVGTNEESHTAQSRLLPILQNDETDPALQELETIFSVEKVTREFFEKYRELFLRLRESLDKIVEKDKKVKADFEEKNIDTVDFSKKLLGQIVFLYFLQKKGWFGVKRGEAWGSGSKKFLRELFAKKHGNYNNFYNDILEPLFYEALRLERPGDYYSHFNCRIPFLNGGLFDPLNDYDWWNVDIFLPDDIFSNERKTKEGDIGDGILDIFDRYNFTVKEDEPLEKEVAVDPEMLGKVFENLLEVKDRKSKGTYYTPREIVHYMCQESLANYLATEFTGKVDKNNIKTLIEHGESVIENDSHVVNEGRETGRYTFKLPQRIREHANLIDEKLASIRVCDPAVGSGAFPVGMMNEIIRARSALTPYLNTNEKRLPYHFKREAIQNCLYGVDIDPGAVEITKLRLWLSLIVDEKDREIIQPLPNLDYKIMQGNSLLSEFMGIDFDKENDSQNGQLFIAEDDINSMVEELKNKKDEYLNKGSVREKQNLKQEIEDLIIEIFERKLKKQKADYFKKIKVIEEKYSGFPNKEQRESIIKAEKEKLHKESGFSLEQFENQLREYTTGNKIRPFFPWRLYFAEVFHEKEGFDVVIANPPYIEHKKLKSINSLIKGKLKVYSGTADLYVYFYEIALNILREKGILIFISSNKFIRARYGVPLRSLLASYRIHNIVDFTKVRVFDALVASCIILVSKDKPADNVIVSFADDTFTENLADYIENNHIKLQPASLKSEMWQLEDATKLKIKERIESETQKLETIKGVNIFRGVTTGYNPAFTIDSEKRNELIQEDEKSKSIIKPMLQGRNIRKWSYHKSNLYLIFTRRGINISKYFSIKKHLSLFKDQLEPGKGRKPGNYYWYEIQDNTAYHKEFEKDKVIWALTSDKWTFAYDEKGHYLPSNGYILTSTELSIKYLLALMNSRLMKFYFSFVGIMTAGGAYTLKQETIAEFPIMVLPEKEQNPLIRLVENILAIAKDDDYLENSTKQAKVRDYEKQIDQLVYELYDLAPEEIDIVESESR